MAPIDKWTKIGKHHRNGSVVPIAFLRSETSLGIGDFSDLEKYITYCHILKHSIVQILPIFDSGPNNLWPYSVMSGFAINPVYISIDWVLHQFNISPSDTHQGYFENLAKLESENTIQYPAVRLEKIQLLRVIYGDIQAGIQDELDCFENYHHWIRDYVRYDLIAAKFGTDWKKWPTTLKDRDLEALHQWDQKADEDARFLIFLQWISDIQLVRIHTTAKKLGVMIKGDIPLFVDGASVDCWAHPDYFLPQYCAGAPPDVFTSGGQEWGFPPLNFQNPAALQYFISRFTRMDHVWDAVRIDHILGIFRIMIWNPDQGNIANSGFFYPQRVGETASYWTRADCQCVGIDPDRFGYQEGIVTDCQDLAELVDSIINIGLAKRIRTRNQIAWISDHRLESVPDIEWADIDRYDHNLDKSENEIRETLQFNGWSDNNIERVLVARRRLQPMLTHYTGKKDAFVFTFYGKQTWQYQNLDPIQQRMINQLLEEKQSKQYDMWHQVGHRILEKLDGATSMVLCGEDLGLVDPYVAETLQSLQILGLNVLRWEHSFDPNLIREPAVLVPATHDTETILQWWASLDPSTRNRFFSEGLGRSDPAPAQLSTYDHQAILSMHTQTTARWTIIPLWEWLTAFYDHPDVRINTPGTIHDTNWCQRMRMYISDLV